MFKIKVRISWKNQGELECSEDVEFFDFEEAIKQNIPGKPVDSFEQYANLIYGYPNAVGDYIRRKFPEYKEEITSMTDFFICLESKVVKDSLDEIKLYEYPCGSDEFIIMATVKNECNPKEFWKLPIGRITEGKKYIVEYQCE